MWFLKNPLGKKTPFVKLLKKKVGTGQIKKITSFSSVLC